MSKANDPAFPIASLVSARIYSEGDPYLGPCGLTKRELFAAMAMQGLVTQAVHVIEEHGLTEEQNAGFLAEAAVHYADALLTALEKPRE
jgi:hypothetical protein